MPLGFVESRAFLFTPLWDRGSGRIAVESNGHRSGATRPDQFLDVETNQPERDAIFVHHMIPKRHPSQHWRGEGAGNCPYRQDDVVSAESGRTLDNLMSALLVAAHGGELLPQEDLGRSLDRFVW